MTTTTLHPLADDYLHRLWRAGRKLPRGERRELVGEIEAHLTEATDPWMSDAEVLTVLGRLGDPEDIVAAEFPDERAERQGAGVQEWAAIFLLLFGGFIFLVGWIAGAVLLWSSRRWTTRDKLIGTFVVPGGLASAFVGLAVGGSTSSGACYGYAGGPIHCTGGGGPGTLSSIASLALLAFLVLGPIVTAVYLARRAR